MDHISKALERAKSEQQSVRSWVRPEVSPEPDARGGVRETVRVEELRRDLVTLNPEVLKANHVLCGPASDDPAITDKYRLLRTRLLQLMSPQGWSKLGITSPGPRAGKTLNALNLAISIARDRNHHVFLIDADLRKPALAQTLGLDPDLGLIDYLASDVPIRDIAITPEALEHLTIVPGREVESVAEALGYLKSKKMSRLLDELDRSTGSTVIIVDLPPVLIGDDVITVASLLDTMLLIIDEGGTDLEDLKGTAELLEPFNLIGTVLNKSTERSRDVGGYYSS